MDTIHEDNVVIQPLRPTWFGGKVGCVDILRLDLLHPVISGNKWYKLVLNIAYAKDNGFDTIVTFGGGYSNHLAATAHAAKRAGLQSVGIVRGKYAELTPTLKACAEEGMKLIFVTREDYDGKGEPEWEKELSQHFDQLLIIPEGGANDRGRKGAGLIKYFIQPFYTHIAVSVGSGTTLAGLRNKLPSSQVILGFAPMKGGAYLKGHIAHFLELGHELDWELFDRWHFRGFGKWNDGLIAFMNDFYEENCIPLDIVYTSKMMHGIKELLNENYFKPTDKILCIHTGGLQGNSSVAGKLIY